jgi:hypothetical protein
MFDKQLNMDVLSNPGAKNLGVVGAFLVMIL